MNILEGKHLISFPLQVWNIWWDGSYQAPNQPASRWVGKHIIKSKDRPLFNQITFVFFSFSLAFTVFFVLLLGSIHRSPMYVCVLVCKSSFNASLGTHLTSYLWTNRPTVRGSVHERFYCTTVIAYFWWCCTKRIKKSPVCLFSGCCWKNFNCLRRV